MINLRKTSLLCLAACVFAVSCSSKKEVSIADAKTFVTEKYKDKTSKNTTKTSHVYDCTESKGEGKNEADISLAYFATSFGITYTKGTYKLSFEDTDHPVTSDVINSDYIETLSKTYGDTIKFYTQGNEFTYEVNSTSSASSLSVSSVYNSDGVTKSLYQKLYQKTDDNNIFAMTSTVTYTY